MSATSSLAPASLHKVPETDLGQMVYWYPHGAKTNSPHAAFVTKRGHDSVCLAILHPNSHNFTIRDGVRHVSDPRVKQVEFLESGGWDHTPATLRLQKLEEIVARLSK